MGNVFFCGGENQNSRALFSFKNSLTCLNLILPTLFMNANIINSQIVHNIKFDLKGHWRSYNHFFLISVLFSYDFNLDIHSLRQLSFLFPTQFKTLSLKLSSTQLLKKHLFSSMDFLLKRGQENALSRFPFL